jgi:hypothetical protein
MNNAIFSEINPNAIKINSIITDVELSNYNEIQYGSISSKIFLRLFILIHEDNYFNKLYNYYKNKITNIDEQYDNLKCCLYFDKNIDEIEKDVINFFIEYNKNNQIKHTSEHVNLIPINTLIGGEITLVRDVRHFLVFGVKFLAGDTTPDKLNVNNFFNDIFFFYNSQIMKINVYNKYNVNTIKLQNYAMIYCFLRCLYEILKTKINNINNQYVTDVLNVMQNDFINMYKKFNSNNDLMQIVGPFNVNDVLQMKNKMVEIKEKLNTYVNHINQFTDIQLKNEKIKSEIEKVNQQIHEINEKIMYQREKINKSIFNSKPSFTDVSGTVKSYKRRVFLIKGYKNYGIKISSDKYPEYKIEGAIYNIFNKIMNDDDETQKNIIKKRVLNSYFCSEIGNIKNTSEFKIYIDNDSFFVANNNENSTIYNAIKEIAYQNNSDKIIYYTTENILGEWDTLENMKSKLPDNSICDLIANLFNLLHYLNKKYNFAHWDPHHGNIFVNMKNPTDFKLYDFDLSEITYKEVTQYSINNHLLDMLSNYDTLGLASSIKSRSTDDRKKILLIHDFYRVLTSFFKEEYFNTVSFNNKIIEQLYYICKKTFILTNSNYWYSLILAAITTYNKKYFPIDTDISIWIDYCFNIKLLKGGNTDYYVKYLKYKNKYLKNKKTF